MHRTWMAVATVAVLLLGAVAAAREIVASAQDATPVSGPAAAADHPVVGTWRWLNDREHATDPSYAVIHADGTYVEFYPPHGVGIGAWEATGERTASLTIVFQETDPAAPGLLTYRLAVVAADGGNALTATGPFYLQALDGSVVEERAFDGTATRIEVAETGPLPLPRAVSGQAVTIEVRTRAEATAAARRAGLLEPAAAPPGASPGS